MNWSDSMKKNGEYEIEYNKSLKFIDHINTLHKLTERDKYMITTFLNTLLTEFEDCKLRYSYEKHFNLYLEEKNSKLANEVRELKAKMNRTFTVILKGENNND